MEILKIIANEFGANCYLIVSGNEAAVIDPGGEPEKILGEIKKSGVKLKYIILTHHHFDHALAAEDLKKSTGAEILFHELEKKYTNLSADKFIGEGDKIKIGNGVLKIVHTPGHSKGSICLMGEGIFFSGDTLFENGFGRTDYPGGSESAMKESLARITKILNPGMKIYPGHGDVFEI